MRYLKPTCLAVLAAICAQFGADSAVAKQRERRCVCPEKTVEKTQTEQPCETRTVYRRVVERRTVYVEPAAVVAAPAYVAYPAYSYAYPAYSVGYYGSVGYPYGYAYGGSGIVDAGFGGYAIGAGGWGW
jgi:hypothetical protein